MSMETYIDYIYGFRFDGDTKTDSKTYTEGFKKLLKRAPKSKAIFEKVLSDYGLSWNSFECFESPADEIENSFGEEDGFLTEYIFNAIKEIYEPKLGMNIFDYHSSDDYDGPIIGVFKGDPWDFNNLTKKIEKKDIDNILKYNLQPMFKEPITFTEHKWEVYG